MRPSKKCQVFCSWKSGNFCTASLMRDFYEAGQEATTGTPHGKAHDEGSGLQEELHISLSLAQRGQVALEFSLWIIVHYSLWTPQTALAVVNIKSRFIILFSRQIFSGRLMCGWFYGQILKGKQHNGTESHFTDFWRRISFSHLYPSLVVSPDQTTESLNWCWLTHENR